MELSKSSFIEVINMPVLDFKKYMDWKIKFDNDREKQRAAALGKIRR